MYDFGDIKWKIKFDKERLRSECSACVSALTLEDREITEYIEDTELSPEEVFETYNSKTKQQLDDIESDSVSKKTRDCLTKTVKLNYPKSEELFSQIIEARRQQILDEFMGYLGLVELCEIENFSASKFSSLITRFCNYTKSSEIVEEYGITLLDRNLSKHQQRKARRQIWREQKSDIKDETKRLTKMESKIKKLVRKDNTFELIVDNNLDTMIVLGLRQEWQKKLSGIEPTSLKVKQVFDDATRKYIETVIANYSYSNDEQTLQDLRGVENNITNVIMTIFELDNTSCNNLIHIAYEYKKLCDEKSDLELSLKNRQKFLLG